MSNSFGTDFLLQAENPMEAAGFYVKHLGFKITHKTPELVSLYGKNINLFIEPGSALGPVLEVFVKNVGQTRKKLFKHGCKIVKDETQFPRCHLRDPNGLIYNVAKPQRSKP